MLCIDAHRVHPVTAEARTESAAQERSEGLPSGIGPVVVRALDGQRPALRVVRASAEAVDPCAEHARPRGSARAARARRTPPSTARRWRRGRRDRTGTRSPPRARRSSRRPPPPSCGRSPSPGSDSRRTRQLRGDGGRRPAPAPCARARPAACRERDGGSDTSSLWWSSATTNMFACSRAASILAESVRPSTASQNDPVIRSRTAVRVRNSISAGLQMREVLRRAGTR